MEKEKKTLLDRVWDLLASIKFAIVIFSLISLTAIIGTVLEQRAEPAKNIQILTRIFGESLAPTMYRIFDEFGFMDMYHSWWFVTLLVLLSANIIICSIDRLPKIWKTVREPIKPITLERLETLTIKRELLLKGRPENVKDSVKNALKRAGFRSTESKEDKGYQFYSQKGNYTRLGVYITHLSIILILIGALLGIFFGFKGSLFLPEGASYPVAFVNTVSLTHSEEHERDGIIDALEKSSGNVSKASMQLGMDRSSLKAKLQRYGLQPLGFSIRCDDFDIDFYEGSDMPRKYISWLTVIEDGKEVLRKAIEVNEPLKYKGITFYQSTYGTVPGGQGFFILRVTPLSGISEINRLNFGDRFIIPGTNTEGTIKDFSPALTFDQGGRPFTYSRMMNNPAVFIDFREKGKEKYSGWIFKRYPMTWRLPEGHTVEFIDLWGAQYTGLQVRRDPGVWIVYLGCITMSLGLYIAFFISHRRVWVKILEEKNHTRVFIGAASNKNRYAFERKLDKMVAILQEKQGG